MRERFADENRGRDPVYGKTRKDATDRLAKALSGALSHRPKLVVYAQMGSETDETVGRQEWQRRRALRRRQFRRRRLGALAVVACLSFGVWMNVGGVAQETGVKSAAAPVQLAFSGAASQPEPRADDGWAIAFRGGEQSPGTEEASAGSPPPEETATEEPPSEESGEETESVSGEPINVLLLGVDERPESVEGEGTRSDTMIVGRVTPETGEVKLLSIPRDMLVEVEPGEEEKINSAYALGGIEQTRNVVENFTGLQIDHHAVIDFEGFEAVVDALGGVPVEVEDGFPNNKHIRDGEQTLNGEQALFYARYRGTPTGDLDRIKHQQQVISGLRSEALRLGTVTELPQIAQATMGRVETDVGLTEAVSLGRVLMSRGDAPMTSARLEGTPETLPDGEWVFAPDHEANEEILENFKE